MVEKAWWLGLCLRQQELTVLLQLGREADSWEVGFPITVPISSSEPLSAEGPLPRQGY